VSTGMTKTKSAFSVYNERKNIIINYGRVHKRTLQMNKRNKRTNVQTKQTKQTSERRAKRTNERRAENK
jgi:hypothetical protein